MISYLSGTVFDEKDGIVTLLVGGVGFSLRAVSSKNFKKESLASFYIYLHWNQEQGPSLYGFDTEIDKTVFMLIIQCPKIGPSIATSVLTAMSAQQFLHAITAQDEKVLSKIKGFGPKKAEQIIAHLRHKVSKGISDGTLHSDEQHSFTEWQQITQVLISLNYSSSEISRSLTHLTKNYSDQNYSLDQLIRASLSFLSKPLK